MNKEWLNKRPLKQQLLVLVTGIVVAAIVIFAVENSMMHRKIVLDTYARSTHTQLDAIRLGLEIGLEQEDFQSIEEILSWVRRNDNIEYMMITDEEDEVIAIYPDSVAATLSDIEKISTDVATKEDQFVRSTTWYSDISGVGNLYIVFNTKYLRQAEQQAVFRIMILASFLIIGTGVSSFLIAQGITKPLESLQKVTQLVSSDSLDTRANENAGSLELQAVAASFNAMLDKLDHAQTKRIEEMEQYNQSLEQQNIKLIQAYDALDQQRKKLEEESKRATIALEKLKSAQVQLIQAEKMASLGQLVASVAHELNTPSGAIYSAINEISKDYVEIMDDTATLVNQLSPRDGLIYLNSLKRIIVNTQNLSTVEIRSLSQELAKILEQTNLSNVNYHARLLAQVGFSPELTTEIFPLLSSKYGELVIRSLHNIGMSRIHIRDIEIAISRIIHLVKALKTYSRIDSDSFGVTDIAQDLNNTLIILNNKIKRAITVHKEFDALPKVRCYPGRLNQVWTNLIHNSIQAMKGKGDIYLRLKKIDDNHFCVEVEDNGPGIDPDILPNIFEPYFTTKEMGEGTGLGLSIVKDIIEAHHGTIQVTSQPGKTVFKVTLPISNDFPKKNSVNPIQDDNIDKGQIRAKN